MHKHAPFGGHHIYSIGRQNLKENNLQTKSTLVELGVQSHVLQVYISNSENNFLRLLVTWQPHAYLKISSMSEYQKGD